MTYVTDTHPLIWFLEGNTRLSQAARQAFSQQHIQIVIPTIALVEIKYLYSRKRIRVDLATTLNHAASVTNCRIHPMDETVFAQIPTSLDIHDAIIVGTALTCRDVLGESVALITKDAAITASGLVSVLW